MIPRNSNANVDIQQRTLRWVMRIYGAVIACATATFYWLPAFGRWEPANIAYERMFAALFFAWGLMLYRGAANPAQSLGLIDFTALQGLLHGGVMAFELFAHSHEHNLLHLLGDVPFHLSMFIVFGYLRRFAPETPPVQIKRSQWIWTIILFGGIGLFVFDAVFFRLQ